MTSSEAKNNFNLTLAGYKFKVCPIGVITEESINFFNLFTICKEFNSLPEQGGIFDQDNRTIQSFEVIANEIAKIENKEMKKTNDKSKNLSSNIPKKGMS